MIAEAESRGERVLCPMRSALAVTSGYFEGKEGALTRIHSRGGYLYSLDAELGEADTAVGHEAVEAFVATYLNAARVGRQKLTHAFESRSTVATSNKDWLPNACTDCPFQEKCHEAFGESEGFGSTHSIAPRCNASSTRRRMSSTHGTSSRSSKVRSARSTPF